MLADGLRAPVDFEKVQAGPVRKLLQRCSGLMYAAVPRMTPAYVACTDSIGEFIAAEACDPMLDAGAVALARPKSRTFTVPSARTLMFAGLRSRWMIPCSCAASSASAICFAIGSASSIGMMGSALVRFAVRQHARPEYEHRRSIPSSSRRTVIRVLGSWKAEPLLAGKGRGCLTAHAHGISGSMAG